MGYEDPRDPRTCHRSQARRVQWVGSGEVSKTDSRMDKLEDETGVLERDLGDLPKVSKAGGYGFSCKILTESTVSVRCKEFSSSRTLVADAKVSAW